MEIRRYIALVRHWLWLIVLGVILAGGLAYFLNSRQAPVYSSSPVRLLIDQGPGERYADVLLERNLAQTYIELFRTRPIMEAALENLDVPYGPSVLASRISVSSPENGQIIDVTAIDENPEMAAEIANAVALAFIENNEQRERNRYGESIARYEAALEDLRDDRQAIETQILELGVSETPEEEALLSRLQTQRNEIELRYTQTFNDLTTLGVTLDSESSNVLIIDEARPIRRPIRPRTLNNTIIAAILGGMAALGFIFLLEYLDDTVRSPEHIQADTGLSTMGAIGFIPGATREERLIVNSSPRSPVAEAFRVLRTNLAYSAVDSDLSSLLITSSTPEEGKSTISSNLAVVMAQTGKRVILIDADLRRPTLHKTFDIANNHGLTTALLDNKAPIQAHLQNTNIKGLRLMTSGPIPPNPAELLNSQRMQGVIETLKDEADLLIFDTPPALTVADASILAPYTDGCLVVVQIGRTGRDLLVETVERLSKSGATIFGILMNRMQQGRSLYYDHYYYRYYGNDYNYSREMPMSQRRVPAWVPRWLTGTNNR